MYELHIYWLLIYYVFHVPVFEQYFFEILYKSWIYHTESFWFLAYSRIPGRTRLDRQNSWVKWGLFTWVDVLWACSRYSALEVHITICPLYSAHCKQVSEQLTSPFAAISLEGTPNTFWPSYSKCWLIISCFRVWLLRQCVRWVLLEKAMCTPTTPDGDLIHDRNPAQTYNFYDLL